MSAIPRRSAVTVLHIVWAAALLAAPWLWTPPATATAPAGSTFHTDIVGPPGSGQFGYVAIPLPNGNLLIADPGYDAGEVADVGAAYLYDGATGQVISAITGSTAGDQIGSGYSVLSNGNYVLCSELWDNGSEADAGAVTWCDADSGCSGVVSSANSLVGSSASDQTGDRGVVELANGNYVVVTPTRDNGDVVDAGAATWCSGAAGCSGTVSPANSLVGSQAGDQVGYAAALRNGHYVAMSRLWDNGGIADAGAATWCDGTTGCTGTISAANSLVGSRAGDEIGRLTLALSNGDYVTRSALWDNDTAADAGAITWCDGTAGCSGAVSPANSLVGSQPNDKVGSTCLVELTNGNYVVCSPLWDSGVVADAGAATWCDGTGGCAGSVSAANSLVGSQAGDQVSAWYAKALANGNYVVSSPYWDNGLLADSGALTWGDGTAGLVGTVSEANSLVGGSADDQTGYAVPLSNGHYVASSYDWDSGAVGDAGAATWCNGTTGCTGFISAANSLVGTAAQDSVGHHITPLTNGNYVVSSAAWDDGTTANVGAATWCDGTGGCTGAVSGANSLVGSQAGDQVGSTHPTALTNGNYVVGSPNWHHGATAGAGAVTWCSGTEGCTGAVSADNSLVGSQTNDWAGHYTQPLSGGNYAVRSWDWDLGPIVDAGAVTWGNGLTGTRGAITAANSLVGSTAGDLVGGWAVMALADGSYVVFSDTWDYGSTVDAGAVTWAKPGGGTTGPITGWNSVRGVAAGGGATIGFDYDAVNNQIVVGRPAENMVTLFRPSYGGFLPAVFRSAP